jgi:hypothetical protein
MDKAAFISRLQRERDKFELLLNRVGFMRRMTMKGVSGGLSVKDLLADILTRQQFIADRLSEILHGETYSPCASQIALDDFHGKFGYPDYESPLVEREVRSHIVTYKHKNISLDDIVEQELAAYANILFTLEKLTHNQCLDHDLFHRIAEQTYKPYRKTGIEINRWLKSTTTESN